MNSRKKSSHVFGRRFGGHTSITAMPQSPFVVAANHYRAGQLAEAKRILDRLQAERPDHADVLHLAGLVQRDLGEPEQALPLIERAIVLEPGLAAAYANLGTVLSALKRFGDAASSYERALALDPNNRAAHSNLSLALVELGRYDDALAAAHIAAKRHHTSAEVMNNLGVIHKTRGEIALAIECFTRARQLNPKLSLPHYNLGAALQDAGRTDDAIVAFEQCTALNPDFKRAKWAALMALPILYDTEEEIRRARQRWIDGLEAMDAELSVDDPKGIDDAVSAVTDRTNFFLHYQGCNDRALQEKFGALLTRVATKAFPEAATPAAVAATGGPIKVGFLSSHFRHHTVCKLFRSWVTDLDRARFETHVFHTSARCDETTRQVAESVDHYHWLAGTHSAVVDAVRRAKLDILIYLDFGMDARNQLLAPLHLAPVQCVTWGHPVTTGLHSIDYFLTSELMEPEGAEDHYSETLVRLPNLSISYRLPETGHATTGAIDPERPADAPVFLCSQSLFKLLPQFDPLYARIAKAVGRCRLWFIAGDNRELTNRFRKRLARAFRALDLEPEAFVHIIDRMDQQAFFAMNKAADVVLDSPMWSGGNTTMEAIACGKPVVTLPGPMMRGRHTYAINRMLGMDELIAQDEDHYIAIAARLGTDATYRARISRDIEHWSGRIFDDRAAIQGLKDFIIHACRPAVSTPSAGR
jgi:protein O-GlcNAc transferase